MCSNNVDEIKNVLENIFMKCDMESKGVVELQTLIHFISAQVPDWQDNKDIEQDLMGVLGCQKSTDLVSKEHFINSLLIWLKNKEEQNNNIGPTPQNIPEDCGQQKLSSDSSGVGDSREITSSSSIEDNDNFPAVQFISDGQSFSTEEFEELAFSEDNESPRSNQRLLSMLEEEINSLQRRNESIERTNLSLTNQLSCLEEVVLKKEKELESTLKQLSLSNEMFEKHKLKCEEAKQKLSLLVEENKSIVVQLSYCEREKRELREFVKDLENKIENLTGEIVEETRSNQELNSRLNNVTDLLKKSEQELENYKVEAEHNKDVTEKLLAENLELKNQSNSDSVIIKNLKSDLRATLKGMSELQNERVTRKNVSQDFSDELSYDDSKTIFDEHLTLNSTVQFNDSLLAELDVLSPSPKNRNCSCINILAFPLCSTYVNTDTIATSDASMNTEEVNNNKIFPEETDLKTNNCEFCHLKSKRSHKKWIVIGIILLVLAFMVGVLSFHLIFLYNMQQSQHHYCLSSFLEFLPFPVKYSVSEYIS